MPEGIAKFERAYEEKKNLQVKESFYKDLHEQEPEHVFNRYMPYTVKIAILQYGRMFTLKLGIYKSLKKVWNKVKNSSR